MIYNLLQSYTGHATHWFSFGLLKPVSSGEGGELTLELVLGIAPGFFFYNSLNGAMANPQ